MRRGTTPTHSFTTDVDLMDAEVIYVSYKQGSRVIVEKTKDDLEFTDEGFSLELSQEETLTFKQGQEVRVQIRARFGDGSAIASNVISTTADEILKDGEI